MNKHLFFLLLFFLLGMVPSAAQVDQVLSLKIPTIDMDNMAQGRLYNPIYYNILGSQYLSKSWLEGDVRILDKTYSDLQFWYDLYIDELILLHLTSDDFNRIQLVKSNIQYFSLGNRKFLNLPFSKYKESGLEKGYYEILFEGTTSLLAKRELALKREGGSATFVRKDKFYWMKDGQAYRLKNKKGLLSLLEEPQTSTVKTYIKKQKLRLRKAGGKEWASVIQYIEALAPKQ